MNKSHPTIFNLAKLKSYPATRIFLFVRRRRHTPLAPRRHRPLQPTNRFYYNRTTHTALRWTKTNQNPLIFYHTTMNRNRGVMYRFFLLLIKIQIIFKLLTSRWSTATPAPQYTATTKQIYFWYFYNYLALLFFFYCDMYAFITTSSHYFNKKTLFPLLFTTRKNKIHTLLLDATNRTLLLLTPGFYQRLLRRPKKFKRTKMLKLLMIRHLRKLLLALRIRRLLLISRRTPLFINEICFFLARPLITKFINPLNQLTIEDGAVAVPFRFVGLVFIKSIPYTHRRFKKFRFLKRKIRRKLVFQNRLVD